MHLVANGCSHTAGAEMEFPYQGKCYDKAWPKYLADSLGCSHTNLSNSGASSHRVVRTTMRYVLDNFKAKNTLKDHFFVILWPGAYRTEIRGTSNLYHDDGWMPLVVGNDEDYKKSLPKSIYNYYRSWVITSEEPIKARMDYLHDILFLQHFFVTYKIKFLFWAASYVNIIDDMQELSGYKSLIFKKTFPHFSDISQSYNVLLPANGQKITKHSIAGGFNSHFDEDAQIWFAHHLNKYILSNALLP